MPREDLAVRAGLRDLVPVGVNRFCVVVVLGSRGHVPRPGGRRGGGAGHGVLRRRRIRVACAARTWEMGACHESVPDTGVTGAWYSPTHTFVSDPGTIRRRRQPITGKATDSALVSEVLERTPQRQHT
jgi:hypothetical protein